MSYITEGDTFRGFLKISSPIVANNILQSILEIVDLYFVGRLGVSAIAGVAMCGTIVMVLMSIIIGIATANTVFVSRFYGAKDMQNVGKTIVHSLYLGIVSSLLLAIFGALFAKDMLLLLGADETVAVIGASYLRILFTGIFTMILLWIVSSSLQSCGDSLTPMIIMVIANLANIAFDPLFISGYGIVPALGAAGAALATVTSRGIGLVIGFWILFSGRSLISFPSENKLDLHLIWRLIRVGIPNTVQSGTRSVTFLAMMAIVALYGTAAVSAYGIAGRIELVALMPGFGIATGTAIIVGQNLGAKKPERVEKGVMLSLFLYGAFMILVSVTYYFLAPQIMEFFDPSGASTTIGISYFHALTPFYLVIAISIILSFALNGAGDTKNPMYAALFSMVLLQIPLAYYLPILLNIGIEGVWLAMIIGIVMETLFLFWVYRRGKWKNIII
ncbi:MAG: MATE family efflux transporter [Methanotrichaceae archaeon]